MRRSALGGEAGCYGQFSSESSLARVLGCFWPRFSSREVLGRTRSGLGWPTRARALALTALTAENVLFLAGFFGICACSRYKSSGSVENLPSGAQALIIQYVFGTSKLVL